MSAALMIGGAALVLVVAGALAVALVFGGPRRLPPMASVANPYASVDFSDLPPLERFTARDGTALAFRAYRQPAQAARDCVVLVHGSSSRSDGMHVLAKGLRAQGHLVYALDMRGHGASGEKGQIDYVGQLEDDLEDLLAAEKPTGKKFLVGFSAGGGFALRFAADARGRAFDGYLLLAPFLSQKAGTYRPGSGGWASVGVARIVALLALNRLGISGFNHLPVTAYALTPEAAQRLTPRYAYALAMNFRPHNDYRADIASVAAPMEVLVGADDDQFFASRFAAEFAASGRQIPVTIVAGTGHMDLTLSPIAIAAAEQAITRLARAG